MNPASYMLDVLGGTDSSGAGAGVAGASAAGGTMMSPVASAAPHATPAASPGGTTPAAAGPADSPNAAAGAAANGGAPLAALAMSGQQVQAHLHASPQWATTLALIAKHAVPAPGATKVTFTSSRARSFAFQYAVLVGRFARSYARNIGLNFGRWFALTFLNLLFGIIWYDIYKKSTDVAGALWLVVAWVCTHATAGTGRRAARFTIHSASGRPLLQVSKPSSLPSS